MAARTEPSPVRGSADLIAARLGGSAITLAGTAIVARTLSPRDWGAYTFVLGLATILGLLFDFQVSRLVLVELVEERRDPGAVLGSFLTLRLGLGAASYLAALAFAAPAYPSLVAATSVGALTIVFGAGWNALFLYFQARLRLRAVALWLTVARIVFLGLVALFAVAGS